MRKIVRTNTCAHKHTIFHRTIRLWHKYVPEHPDGDLQSWHKHANAVTHITVSCAHEWWELLSWTCATKSLRTVLYWSESRAPIHLTQLISSSINTFWAAELQDDQETLSKGIFVVVRLIHCMLMMTPHTAVFNCFLDSHWIVWPLELKCRTIYTL